VLGDNEFECLHYKEDAVITKALSSKDGPFLFKLKEKEGHLVVDLLKGEEQHLPMASAYVKKWFDLERDLSPFYEKLEADPDFAFMATQFKGLRLMGIPNLFEAMCWSILGQQINITFAAKLKRRLVENFGQSVETEEQTFWLFPEPEVIAGLEVAQLRPFQISQRKAEYLIGLARLFAAGTLSKAQLEALGEAEAVLKELTKIRGIGLWSANYAMMKSLNLPNSIPYGDTGLSSALHRLKGTERYPSKEVIDEIFAPFDGWKAYLTRYLWRSLSED
jgi:DNA-3-methyladenine glycosylase II